MRKSADRTGWIDDKILSIRKIGDLDNLSSEIFITFEKSEEFSTDKRCCPNFENLWLNAKEGSKVSIRFNGDILQEIRPLC